MVWAIFFIKTWVTEVSLQKNFCINVSFDMKSIGSTEVTSKVVLKILTKPSMADCSFDSIASYWYLRNSISEISKKIVGKYVWSKVVCKWESWHVQICD